MKKSLAITALAIACFSAGAQDRSLFEKKMLVVGADTLLYRELYPLAYEKGRKYPVVLFLHGSGERGNDNEKQLTWGADLFLDSAKRAAFPAIVIFPQCPAGSSWAPVERNNNDSLGFSFPDKPGTKPLQLVMELMNRLVEDKEANPKKIYVGGLSMGGFGTYDILWRMPGFFAAAFPICGGSNPDHVKDYAKNFPIWVFHGASDPVVPVANARLMVRVLRETGAKVKYSEYPGVGHDSWKNAFAEPDLLPWLFEQKKRK